jgi:hypothetical protein
MALIDEVEKVCKRLGPKGWAKLLKKHDDLDITKRDLAAELDRVIDVDRRVPGFEDFALEGKRGVEPGCPARSLLYHALASPNVREVDGKELGAFPTLQELESVENYVFGVRPPTVAELSALAAGDLMAIVVFAVEYRAAVETVHRKHADLCYSRTGVARVGTAAALYDDRARGFTPFVAGKDREYRVLPARYAAYVAVQRTGDESSFGPMRFDFRPRNPQAFEGYPGPSGSDGGRKFWVPLHKLFNGNECLADHRDLRVDLVAHHVNEKIRRIHLELIRRGRDTGWNRPDIDKPPFRFVEGIAAFSTRKAFGRGLLEPVPHDRVVEPATYKGKPLTFKVSANQSLFSPSLTIGSRGGARPAPEYVHVRTVPDAAVKNLNDRPEVDALVKAGGYRAQHYVDFTGDGWIEPICPALNVELPRLIPAYSLVTAPDFFFTCDQRELMDWWLERAPTALRKFLWETPPLTLADERIAPNLKLNNEDFDSGEPGETRANFRPEDDTVTTIVAMPVRGDRQARPLMPAFDARHTWMPDGAAGVFAPGWDTSFDRTGNVEHLAAYGLGSPFPEDSKLCAALSTYWPSVAPDAGRSFWDLSAEIFPTVSPLTDEEVGTVGALPWDGVRGPRVVRSNGADVIEYADFRYVDYVENALKNRFSLALTGRVDTLRYTARVLAMARAYLAVGVRINAPGLKNRWNVLSFRAVDEGSAEVKAALRQAGSVALGGDVFRIEMYRPEAVEPQPRDHRKVHVGMRERTVLFVGATNRVVMKADEARFVARTVPV